MTSTTTLQYVRTPMGRAAAFTPDAKLPPALKAMLKAVDGKTSVSALMVQFVEHDAADLLSQLEEEGLIKLRGERLADFQPSGAVPDVVDSPNAADAADVSERAFASTSSAALELPQVVYPIAAPHCAVAVARIVEVMTTFVLTHIPQQAFTLLAELESFQTLDELEAGLPGYALLAQAQGPAGIVHLAELTERLREAAAA